MLIDRRPGIPDPASALRAVIGPILMVYLLLDLWSAFELRGLFADGAGYITGILQHDQVQYVEPSRRTVQFLQQFPTVIAFRFDLLDLRGLMVLFSATLQLLPLFLLSLCYLVLPDGTKVLFLFPLFHFLAGSQAAALVAIAEGPVAAGYFWFLLLFIVFRTQQIKGQLAALVVALPSLYLHEGMVFLSPVLAIAALWQVRERPLLWPLVPWFLIVTTVQAGFILYPFSLDAREAFIQSMLRLKFLVEPRGINVPTVLGLLAALAVLMFVLAERISVGKAQRISWLLVGAYAAGCLALDLSATVSGFMFDHLSQFHARSYGLLLCLPLSVLFMWTLRQPAVPQIWQRTSVIGVIVALALGQMGWQAIATRYWSEFIASFEMVLTNHRGLVSWHDALAGLPPQNAQALIRMNWNWTNPSLSLLLSPHGRVAAIVDVTEMGWQPFDPTNPQELPHSRFFDTALYREALAR